MTESLGDALPRPSFLPDKHPILTRPKKDSRPLNELVIRSQEVHAQPSPHNAEQNVSKSIDREIPVSQEIHAMNQNKKHASLSIPTMPEQTTKRVWWKDILSKPIPTPRFILNAMIDDYHKAFPYVFDENPVRPDVQYEHALYFPPFETLQTKSNPDSFGHKYPLFNEFITQEVSEIAAGKRPILGALFRLASTAIGAGSYRLIYYSSFRRWQNVEQALDRTFGKVERKKMVHRAYFLEGKELAQLEEKTKQAGAPMEEAYRPIRQDKSNIANESFWDKIPGKWKDVVLRIAAGAVAYTGKVTDVMLLSLTSIINVNALMIGAVILGRGLPLLSTIAGSIFPWSLGLNLAMMGGVTVGVMYHEMGHQMTKSMIDANKISTGKT